MLGGIKTTQYLSIGGAGAEVGDEGVEETKGGERCLGYKRAAQDVYRLSQNRPEQVDVLQISSG